MGKNRALLASKALVILGVAALVLGCSVNVNYASTSRSRSLNFMEGMPFMFVTPLEIQTSEKNGGYTDFDAKLSSGRVRMNFDKGKLGNDLPVTFILHIASKEKLSMNQLVELVANAPTYDGTLVGYNSKTSSLKTCQFMAVGYSKKTQTVNGNSKSEVKINVPNDVDSSKPCLFLAELAVPLNSTANIAINGKTYFSKDMDNAQKYDSFMDFAGESSSLTLKELGVYPAE